MKRFSIFTVLFLIGFFSLTAQDLIILRDGNTIEAKVLEISPTEIRYKRFDHLDGPTIVVPSINVLSIRYENGRTEIINSPPVVIPENVPQNVVPQQTGQTSEQGKPNPRLNTIGATLGYQGISAFCFTLRGTASPANYTFFDFNLAFGFNSFSFNGSVNFNAFVPFTKGGWFAGVGIGGGYNDFMGGVISGNITTGFILFDGLNIGYTLQIGNYDGVVNHNAFTGYTYRFKQQESSNTPIPINSYSVTRVRGRVQRRDGNRWVDVKVGDILTKDTLVRISYESSLRIVDWNNRSFRFSEYIDAFGRSIDDLISRK